MKEKIKKERLRRAKKAEAVDKGQGEGGMGVLARKSPRPDLPKTSAEEVKLPELVKG